MTRESSLLINTEISVNFELDSSESFCKYFYSSASNTLHLQRQQRPHSINESLISSGIMSPETDLTELNDIAMNESRKSTTNLNETNDKIEASIDVNTQQSNLSNDKNGQIYDDIDLINAPMHQIGLVGLETPKKSYSNCTSNSDEPFTCSPSDSLTSLIESLGYRFHNNEIESSHMIHEHQTNDSQMSEAFQPLVNEENLVQIYSDEEDDASLDAQCSSGFISVNCGNCTEDEDYEIIDRIIVINALLSDYRSYDRQFAISLLQYQKELNNKPTGWDRLSHETSVQMLSALLWSWIENLVEPILNKNCLCYIVIKAEKPIDALIKLDQCARYTLEYLIRFIGRLNPPEEMRDVLLRHSMAVLTKQRFRLSDGSLVPERKDWSEMRKGTAGRIMLFINRFYQLLD